MRIDLRLKRVKLCLQLQHCRTFFIDQCLLQTFRHGPVGHGQLLEFIQSTVCAVHMPDLLKIFDIRLFHHVLQLPYRPGQNCRPHYDRRQHQGKHDQCRQKGHQKDAPFLSGKGFCALECQDLYIIILRRSACIQDPFFCQDAPFRDPLQHRRIALRIHLFRRTAALIEQFIVVDQNDKSRVRIRPFQS